MCAASGTSTFRGSRSGGRFLRSIYFRIFLHVWLAMLLVGVAVVFLAVTTDVRRAELWRREAKVRQLGSALIAAYERGGAAELAREEARLGRPDRIHALLFRGSGEPLSPEPVGPGLRRLARAADATGDVQHRRDRGGVWFALPFTRDYVLAASLPPPTVAERLWNPRLLTLRLVVSFFFASALCLLIARTVATPIRKLRNATRRVAEGDFSVRISPELGGSTDELSGLARDFDVMAERTEALINAQKRLVTDVSHELRSPLTRLGIAAELVRRRCGAEAAEPLDRIELEVGRLNDLIAQLLSLTVLEGSAGALPDAGPLDLGDLLAEVADDARFEAGHRSRSVTLSADGGDLRLVGSPVLLRQALENVVRNALRYTPEGSGVEVRLARRGGSAVVSVRDHGPGVPEEHLGRLFEPFFRVAEDRDRKSGGVGLGLAIAERAVRLHGGTVTAANAPGGGLLVEVSLPLAGAP